MTRLLAALLTLLLTACDFGPFPDAPDAGRPDGGAPEAPQVLAHFEGPVTIEAPAPTRNLRFGIVWFRALGASPAVRPSGASSSPRTFDAPSRWSLDLTEPPPFAARGAYTTPGGGSGLISYGIVVAFRDADGDGRLTVDTDGYSGDELYGSSAGAMPFDLDDPGAHHAIVWREGTLGSDEGFLRTGFNRAQLVGERLFPAETTHVLISGDLRAGLMFCAEAFTADSSFGCGQRLFRTPAISGQVSDAPGGLTATFSVRAGPRAASDVTLTLNGWLLARDGDTWNHVEASHAVLRPGRNTVHLDGVGLAPTTIEFVLPTRFTLESARTHRAGALAHLEWKESTGAQSYRVRLASSGVELSTETSDPWIDLTLPPKQGQASLVVSAVNVAAEGRHLVISHTDSAMELDLQE